MHILEELPCWENGKGIVSGKRNALYHYVPQTGQLTALSTEAVGAVAVDPQGRRVAYAVTAYDSVHPQKQAVWLWDAETGENLEVLPGGVYDISYAAFMKDGLVLSMTDDARYGTSENDRLYFLNLETGALTLAAAPDRDIGGNVASDCRMADDGRKFVADKDRLYCTLGVDNGAALYAMDADGTLTALTDGEHSLDCFDVRDGEVPCVAMRNMELQELCRLRDGKLAPCTKHNADALRHAAIAQPAPPSFTNADGIRIDGWVLTPPEFDSSKAHPAIFNIRGGPKAIFGPVFFHEMQYWAGLGYVVFFCNPRGSGGRGDAFADLRGRYVSIDYADLMTFADLVLTAFPSIDPSRVCVAGGSYGGFMVNWMIGHTNRFAAAASQRSIANWTSKCLTTDIGYYHNPSQIDGDPWKTPKRFWEKSPLKYAPEVRTPTLFIHSDEDYRCWMAEGLQMFAALKMHGIPTRMCLFSGANHELSRSGKPVNRIRRLREITDWFDAHTARA